MNGETETGFIETSDRLVHDISEEERREIIASLEADILYAPPDFRAGVVRPKRRGWVFPVLVVGISLIVTFLVPWLIGVRFFQDRDPKEVTPTEYESFEGRILAEFRQDKEAEISVKDDQIRRYQERILGLDQRLRLMEGVIQETLDVKESALLDEVESILSDERAQLRAAGRTEAEIAREIESLKSRLDADTEAQLAEFEKENLALYEERLVDLRSERDAIVTAMEETAREREILARTLKEEEEELVTRLYQEKENLAGETTRIRADMAVLEEARRLETLWLTQLASSYRNLLSSLATEDWSAALSYAGALEELLDREEIVALPGVAPRQEADRELIRFLKSYVEASAEGDLVAKMTEARRFVADGENHAAAGRLVEAEESWRRAIAALPVIERAAVGREETRNALLAAYVEGLGREAEALLAAGDERGAVAAWEAGIEAIPEPLRAVLGEYLESWETWKSRSVAESEALIAEMIVAEREAAVMERDEETRRLKDDAALREGELVRENDGLRLRLNGALERVYSLEARIAAANAEIAALSGTAVSETPPTADPGKVEPLVIYRDLPSETRLFGVVLSVLGDIVIVEPLSSYVPEDDSKAAVMRRRGEELIAEIAVGVVYEASTGIARVRITGPGSGALPGETPDVDDLIYVETAIVEIRP